ncbi:Rha family transcriptional regulator [Campylobacter vicugnae]|uniref:Rha family transcriptional regulator n=1 Tax=Campylobacter vicugnae TaxID=1660076 RepID=UPI000A340BDE|nr:Rha family transcriptional regulator [Campylobacter sp. RM8966]
MSKFVVKYDGTPSVSHTIIAQNTDNEARSVRLLIENHLSDFEEFGVLSFEMTKPLNAELGGRPSKIYYLNEPQATLLLTYLQNTPIVREFKKALIKEFYQIKKDFTIGKEKFNQVLSELSQKSSEADEYKAKYYESLERENSLLRDRLRFKSQDLQKSTRLSESEKENIIKLYKSGLSQAEICRKTSRSDTAVRAAIRSAL